jgi:anthranilate synthase component 1
MYYPAFEKFKEMAKEGNLIPVYREILADMETPVSALVKLRSEPHVFLLESVEGGEKWARYTFLGFDSHVIFRVKGEDVLIQKNGEICSYKHEGDPMKSLKDLLHTYRPVPVEGLPRFYGGAVGFLGYDMVRYFEKLPAAAEEDIETDDATFLITDTLMIFDNVKHTIKVVACAVTEEREDLGGVYGEAVRKIDRMIEMLKFPLERRELPGVKKAKDYIVAGDVIQVVLSQRFQMENTRDPIDLYRALRYVNPSPYLFFLKLEDLILIGSSPEVMVRLEEGVAELRPIAGTRRRGKNEQEDRSLSDELLQDPKERAEHVMLVDLGRNVQAQLSDGKDAFDVLRAAFPAGTLSGAPKIRAMEIIDEMEPTRRGPYGGAVGYFSYTGNMDLCITIRTMMIKDGNIFIQAGAGIVADSDPDEEYQECVNKAMGMVQAIRMAASGLEITKKRN